MSFDRGFEWGLKSGVFMNKRLAFEQTYVGYSLGPLGEVAW